MTVEIKVTNELLEELNKYRAESSTIKSIFQNIKQKLQEEENQVCELQSFIYELENTSFDDEQEQKVLLKDEDTEEI